MDVKYIRLAVGILGNCTSFLMYMAPVLTFTKVIRDKSVGQFSCTPYVIALFNCWTYTWYGFPVVSKGWENFLVSTVNGAGMVPECFVICTFLVLAPPKRKWKVVRMLVGVVLMFMVMVMVTIFALHDHKSRKFLVGIVGIISSILLYGSPLLIMRMVIRTKSVQFMPLPLSIFGFLSSSLWMAYGALSRDVLLVAPNVVGCPLGIAQLVLYWVYRKNKETTCTEEKQQKNGAILEDPEIGMIFKTNGNADKKEQLADLEMETHKTELPQKPTTNHGNQAF